MVQKVRAIDYQNMFDLVIQTCGRVDHVVELAVLNNLAITHKINAGIELKLPKTDNELKDYFIKNNISVATNYTKKEFNLIEYKLPQSFPFGL